jgi:hypothetical protein
VDKKCLDDKEQRSIAIELLKSRWDDAWGSCTDVDHLGSPCDPTGAKPMLNIAKGC